MGAMISGFLTAMLVLVCFSLPTLAQPATASAPDIHPATGLKFKPLAGSNAQLMRSIDHGKSEAKPEFGYSLTYVLARPLDGVARINVFHGGLTSIPSGPASTVLVDQFDQLLAEIRELTPEAEGMKIVRTPTECLLGGIAFRCVTLRSVTPKTNVPIHSILAVTGYRNHFLSLWLEWIGTQDDPAAAQVYLDAMVGAMTR